MTSTTKSILKEMPIDLYEEVETGRRRSPTRAELMFDRLIGVPQTKKYENYSNRRKPLKTINKNLSANEKAIDSSESNDSFDHHLSQFEPSAKTSRIKKTTDKRQNRVKFVDSCHKKANKKTEKKTKWKAYPDCTKKTLLEAFERAGLPDYEEIARHTLHVTYIKDYVKAGPPTPPIHEVMKPFEDLLDWSKADNSSDESNLMTGSAAKRSVSGDWETQSSDGQNNEVFEDMDSIADQMVVNVLSKRSLNKSGEQRITKPEFKRESLRTAGVGACRIASTPVQRRHNVTVKNVSPIDSLDSPEVNSMSCKSKPDNSCEAFLPSNIKPQRVIKISVPKQERPLDLAIVEPSISDLNKVTLSMNRSEQLTRSLAVAEDCVNSSDESKTLIEETIRKTGSSGNSRTLRSSDKTLQITTSELSSIFDPFIRSTPLVASKQRHSKNLRYELVVDRSHFDVSMSRMYRSISTSAMDEVSIKTTTIVPVLSSQSSTKTRKQSNLSNAYHLYRKSIASVHSIYNKSCQPFRTVVKTSESEHTFGDVSDPTIRSALKDERDLKKVFDQSLSTTMFSSSKVVSNDGKQSVLTTKQKVLIYCQPNHVIDFKSALNKTVLNKCQKIGEGSYGEVFSSKDSSGRDIVIKIVPLVQNENQTEEDIFAQILPELVISLNFNGLKTGINSNRAPNFIDMMKAMTTRGLFPSKLVEEWDKFDAKRKSENEDPRAYNDRQLYIVLHLGNGGTDLETYKFKSAIESLSIFGQLALALAAAEAAFQFEHRDLHWGNVLISTTTESHLHYSVNGKEFNLSSKGVIASIIDFSLSRMTDNGFTIFDDLAKYSDLFEGVGDYQFDVYRLMRDNNQNDWHKFLPKSNIFWLQYMLDKMINFKKYSSKAKVHKNAIDLMRSFEKTILDFNSANDLILSEDFAHYLSYFQ